MGAIMILAQTSCENNHLGVALTEAR
jgi:hypothetical protein